MIRTAMAMLLAATAVPAAAQDRGGWRSAGPKAQPGRERAADSARPQRQAFEQRGGLPDGGRRGRDGAQAQAQAAPQQGGWQGRGGRNRDGVQQAAEPQAAPQVQGRGWRGRDGAQPQAAQPRPDWRNRDRNPVVAAPAPRADTRRFDGRNNDRGWDGRNEGRPNVTWNGRNNARQSWAPNGRNDWSRRWRDDNRYDWNRWRQQNRSVFRLPRYYAPYNWNYGYRRFGIGAALSSLLWAQDYWIADPWSYRLPEAYGPYRWVRYYNDALLVDIRDGTVVDVVHDMFW